MKRPSAKAAPRTVGVSRRPGPRSAGWPRLAAVLTLLVVATPAAAAPVEDPAVRLRECWPLDTPPRLWRLGDLADPPAHRMMVTSSRVDPGTIRLGFSGKPGQAEGASNIEQFRWVEGSGGRAWLWLDRYIDHDQSTGAWAEHPVFSHRILLTPAGEPTRDLVADGTYARHGGRGQPYLLEDPAVTAYRLQVWGTIAEPDPAAAAWFWYWDATVSMVAGPVRNDALGGEPVPAMRVEEAWWCNFPVDGGWSPPGGGSLGPDGVPDGAEVRPFRAVWHATGGLPYFVIETPEGEPLWQTASVRPAESSANRSFKPPR